MRLYGVDFELQTAEPSADVTMTFGGGSSFARSLKVKRSELLRPQVLPAGDYCCIYPVMVGGLSRRFFACIDGLTNEDVSVCLYDFANVPDIPVYEIFKACILCGCCAPAQPTLCGVVPSIAASPALSAADWDVRLCGLAYGAGCYIAPICAYVHGYKKIGTEKGCNCAWYDKKLCQARAIVPGGYSFGWCISAFFAAANRTLYQCYGVCYENLPTSSCYVSFPRLNCTAGVCSPWLSSQGCLRHSALTSFGCYCFPTIADYFSVGIKDTICRILTTFGCDIQGNIVCSANTSVLEVPSAAAYELKHCDVECLNYAIDTECLYPRTPGGVETPIDQILVMSQLTDGAPGYGDDSSYKWSRCYQWQDFQTRTTFYGLLPGPLQAADAGWVNTSCCCYSTGRCCFACAVWQPLTGACTSCSAVMPSCCPSFADGNPRVYNADVYEFANGRQKVGIYQLLPYTSERWVIRMKNASGGWDTIYCRVCIDKQPWYPVVSLNGEGCYVLFSTRYWLNANYGVLGYACECGLYVQPDVTIERINCDFGWSALGARQYRCCGFNYLTLTLCAADRDKLTECVGGCFLWGGGRWKIERVDGYNPTSERNSVKVYGVKV